MRDTVDGRNLIHIGAPAEYDTCGVCYFLRKEIKLQPHNKDTKTKECQVQDMSKNIDPFETAVPLPSLALT